MEEVQLQLDDDRQGAFILTDDGQQVGEMVIGLSGEELKVFHTEVLPEWEGQGLGKKLLEAMVNYAREHQLQVIPLCTYVQVQFKRHPDLYEDIWNQSKP